MKYYAGIGSRGTPYLILILMTKIAEYYSKRDYVLRSGGAEGADLAFEKGADDTKEIYIPWRKFNGSDSQLYTVDEDALKLASEHHPAWDRLSMPVRKLMGRNAYQILGSDLDTPVEFVICWTPDCCTDGKDRTRKTGGTGLAISIASSLGIPVYNLADRETFNKFVEMVK